MRRTIFAVLAAAAAFGLAACSSTSPSSSSPPSSSTTAASSPAAAPAGLSCADIGGAFVPHGTDGRGDCEPADQRPRCHVAPADQDEHYVAGFDLTPPFPQGTVAAAQVQTMLDGASNADCWKLPAGQ